MNKVPLSFLFKGAEITKLNREVVNSCIRRIRLKGVLKKDERIDAEGMDLIAVLFYSHNPKKFVKQIRKFVTGNLYN